MTETKEVKTSFYDLKGLSLKPLSTRWSICIIALVSILLYANTFTHEFALDDVAVLTQNTYVKKGVSGLNEILTTGSWDGFNPEKNMKIYRPFQLVTLAIQYEFFKENPIPYHIVHVLFYALLNCLLFLLFREFWKNKYPYLPLIIVLLFAIHPVHSDVISNIKGSADLFAMLNGIAAFLFLFYYIRLNKNYYIVIACVLYFLSLISKEVAVTYLAVFPLAIFFFTKLNLKTIVKYTLPFVGVLLLYIGVRSLVFSGSYALKMSINDMSNSILLADSVNEKLGTILYGLGKNLQLLFFPHPLQTTYVHAEVPVIGLLDFRALATLLAYGFMAFIGVYYFKKKSILVFGILYYIITISLFSNILVMMPSILSERWLLIPSLGFCIVVGALFYKCLEDSKHITSLLKKNITPVLALLALVILFSIKTFDRNFDWKNDITLFKADIKDGPNNHFSLRGYGTELIKFNDSSKIKLGIHYLKKALKIAPNRHGTNNNLAIAYRKLNQLDSSIVAFEKEFKISSSLKIKNSLWDCYNKRGLELMATNKKVDILKSIPYFDKANKLSNSGYLAAHNMGKAYYLLGDFNNAIKTYSYIVKNAPTKYDSVYALAVVYNSAGKYSEALKILSAIKDVESINKAGYNKQFNIAKNALGID